MDRFPAETDAIIIGAGLTGLAAAYYLQKYGKRVLVLEKSSRCGGVINTRSENGFIFETGPNTGVISNPEVAELFEEHSDICRMETANHAAKRRLILKDNTWHALPSGPISAITTPLFTLYDKLRIFKEPFHEVGTFPLESVAGLTRRRLGESFLNYAIDPFISGIYAGDPEKLVTQYALPKLYKLEQNYGSLILGGIKRSREIRNDHRAHKASRKVFSVEGGINNLITALAANLDESSLALNADNSVVERSNYGYSVTFRIKEKAYKVNSKRIICTTGTTALNHIFPFLDEKKVSKITNLNYAKVVQVNLGYTKWKGMKLNAFGGLIPSLESKNILGALFISSMFKGRAPKGGALISAFLGGTKKPELINLSDDQIKRLVLDELMPLLKCKSPEPDLFFISRYQKAIAQYEASSRERLLHISQIQKEFPGLFLAGNIRDGIGMADRIKQAKDIAESINDVV